MDPKAIEHARIRMDRAAAAIVKLQSATAYPKIEEAWSEFLLAAAAIYGKFEQGSKVNGQSLGWYGRKKNERKKDPLLSYIHQARNSDEHGIENITQRSALYRPKNPGEFIPGIGAFIVSGENPTMTDPRIIHPDGTETHIEMARSTFVQLVPVKNDKHGDTFPVPDSHLGTPLKEPTPLDVANLAMAYLKALIEEAEGLVAPQQS